MRTCDGCAVESVRCPLPKWDWEGRHNAEQLCQPVGYFVVLVTALLLLWCCCCYLYRWLLSDARVVAKHVCNALCKLSAANLPPAIFTSFYLSFYHIHPYSATCHCLSPVTFERIRWWSWQALKAGELMTTGWYAPSKGKYANLEGGEGGPCGETGRLDHWTSLDQLGLQRDSESTLVDLTFLFARNRLSRFQDRLRQRYHGYRFASRSPIWTRWRSLLLCDQDKLPCPTGFCRNLHRFSQYESSCLEDGGAWWKEVDLLPQSMGQRQLRPFWQFARMPFGDRPMK